MGEWEPVQKYDLTPRTRCARPYPGFKWPRSGKYVSHHSIPLAVETSSMGSVGTRVRLLCHCAPISTLGWRVIDPQRGSK